MYIYINLKIVMFVYALNVYTNLGGKVVFVNEINIYLGNN